MGLGMFMQTCGKIARNPGVATLLALVRHCLWHVARRVCPLPMRVALTEQSVLQLERRGELNGCVALAWSQRMYDFNNMSFIRELTRRGVAKVCLDVGSNIGPYALIMSETKSTQVFCFEPHPATFAVLKRMLAANGRNQVRVLNAALSDKADTLRFMDVDCNPMNRVLAHGEDQPAIEVQAECGSEFCAREGIAPDLLKIDTEGHEAEVLLGFGTALSDVKVVILEENISQEIISECLPSVTFIGPLYVDFKGRSLSPRKTWAEDAVYINRAALPELADLGFVIESGRTVQSNAGKALQPV